MNLIKQFIAALVDGVAELRLLRKSIDEHTRAVRDARERDNHRDKPENVRAEVFFAEEAQRATNTNNERQYGIQKSLRNWTCAAFIAAATYAGIAGFQLHEMKIATSATEKAANAAVESADASRQQLVASQGAVVQLGAPSYNPDIRQLTITFNNLGYVTGRMDWAGEVQRETLERKPIGEPIKMATSNQEILKSNTYVFKQSLPWPLPEVRDVNFWPGKEIVIFDGSYSYSNGFAETYTRKFCSMFVPTWNLQMPAPYQGGWGDGGWSDIRDTCPSVKDREAEFFGIKRHIADVTTPKK